MKKTACVVACASFVAASAGCGAILNGGPANVSLPQGATVNGASGVVPLSKKSSHQVQYADGRTCVIQSSVSIGYVLADILLTGLIGIVIDGVTGDWKTLSADTCPGVTVD